MLNLHGVIDKAIDIVNKVEAQSVEIKADDSQENLTSEQKKAMAVQMLTACIDIPMLPKFVEGKIFGAVVDMIIEVVVYIHNKFDMFVASKTKAKAATASA